MVICAGIDMGARTTKVLLLRDGEVIGWAMELAGFDAAGCAGEALAAALHSAGVDRGQVQRMVATGVGREEAPDRDACVTEVTCAARGVRQVVPDARTVIDVGAEEARAISLDPQGKVVDFAINDKCAAGSGAFTEAMARALEVPLAELGALSLKSTRAIPMNAQCAVFAESEVVSMIHGNVAKEDMARAVHDAIASRTVAMVRRVGLRPPVALIGGMALNIGFVDSLQKSLELERVEIPRDPEYITALGAALAAAEEA